MRGRGLRHLLWFARRVKHQRQYRYQWSSPIPLIDLFALALEVDIVHSRGGITSFDYEGKAPGSATLRLLSFGLVAAGTLRRRTA